MHLESLETRRMFLIVTFDYGLYDDVIDNARPTSFDILKAVPPTPPEPKNADLNGDSRVDLADFDFFRQNARSSAANNFIRRSAGPGDADGNGQINQLDLRAVTESFNQYGEWRSGDFTMNGRVTIQDFALAGANVLAK